MADSKAGYRYLTGYIKLTGIAKGSLEELKLDYEDFLKSRKLEIWHKDHPRMCQSPNHPNIPKYFSSG
jgi:hypothetical protein